MYRDGAGSEGADERGVAGGNKKSLQSKKQYSKKDTGVALATSSRRDTAGGGLAALYQQRCMDSTEI